MSARHHTPRKRVVGVTLTAVCALSALAWATFGAPAARLVYNASDSVPGGWYRIGPTGSPKVGDIVLVRLPAQPAALAARRGYLPTRIPLLKRVGAIAPQHVCIRDGTVSVDRVRVASVLPADRLGRPLPVWRHCRRLAEGELFLLGLSNPASFDSRYFGPVPITRILGQAWRLGQGETR